MSKPILCVDFDGVIHSYTSGWRGAHVIPDPPVPGAVAFLHDALEHFRVAIFSSRSNQDGGLAAMKDYLLNAVVTEGLDYPPWFDQLEWPTEKPAAFVTLDDRAILFTGTWPSPVELLSFKPWNKK